MAEIAIRGKSVMQFAELFPDVTLATRRADITGAES